MIDVTTKVRITEEELGQALRQVAEWRAGGALEIRNGELWALVPTPNGKWTEKVTFRNRHIYDLFNAAAYLLDTPRVEVPTSE